MSKLVDLAREIRKKSEISVCTIAACIVPKTIVCAHVSVGGLLEDDLDPPQHLVIATIVDEGEGYKALL